VLAAPAGSPGPFVVAKLTAAVAVLAGAVALLRARRSAMGLFVFPNWRRWPLWLGLLAPIWAGAVANVAVGQGPPLARTTLLWLAGTIGVGVYEEALFRGVVPALVSTTQPLLAALVSAGLFSAVHAFLFLSADWRIALAIVLVSAGAGLVFAGVRFLSGSIWPGVAAHATTDFVGIGQAGLANAFAYTPAKFMGLMISAGVLLVWGAALLWALTRRRSPAPESAAQTL
jgi:membrane protease YdiL (CAAX protease family)